MMDFPHEWSWRLNGILRKVVSLPSPYSRLRGVPPLGEVRNESQSKSAKKKLMLARTAPYSQSSERCTT